MVNLNSIPEPDDLLKCLGYSEGSIGNISYELDDLLINIGFDGIENKALKAIDAKDTLSLINTVKELMKSLENKGIYRPDFPAALIRQLVNGLNLRNEDIFAILEKSNLSNKEIRDEQELLASCAAITQLGYIILSRFTGSVKAASSGEHVFILVDGFTGDSMIFVDFSIDSILEINAGEYERSGNNFRLKARVSDDEASKHIAQYYSNFHVAPGTGLSHNIHNNIGIAYDKAGKYEEAISEFNEALRLDPGYVEVYNNLGAAYHSMGLTEDAINSLKEALRLKPGYIEAHCNLGNIYSSTARFDEAFAVLEAALSLEPENAQVHISLGILFEEQEKFPEAIKEFQEAVRLDPDRINVRTRLGVLYAGQGRHEDALREYREALGLDPGLPEVHAGMASAYYELGSFDKSAEAWMRAVRLDPELIECVPEKLMLKVKRGVSRMS